MFAIIQAYKFNPQALISTHPQGLRVATILMRPCSQKRQGETFS